MSTEHNGPGSVHALLTDEELDAALTALHAEVARPDLTAARETLMAAATADPVPALETVRTTGAVGAPRRRRRRRLEWAGAAAAIVALAAGAVVAQHLRSDDDIISAAPTAPTTQQLLDSIHEHDVTLAPGQYLYVAISGTVGGAIVDKGQQRITLTTTWIPADRTGTWRRTTFDGVHPPTTVTVLCGDLPNGEHPNPHPPTDPAAACAQAEQQATWDAPTPVWLAALPTDPQGMLARLGGGSVPAKKLSTSAESQILANAELVLRTGLVPGAVRAVIYQALALMPDMTLTPNHVTSAGQHGLMFKMWEPSWPPGPSNPLEELTVDPATGRLLATEPFLDLHKMSNDTRYYSTAEYLVATGVSDKIGVPPHH